MIGGLLAVVWTESIQTVLLLVGAVCITAGGLLSGRRLVGISRTRWPRPHPLAARRRRQSPCNWGTANFLSMLRGAGDPSNLPWYGDPAGLSR